MTAAGRRGVGMDYALLDGLRSFEHSALGLRETFLTPQIGDAPTVALLTEPLGASRPLGWVVCHSQGLEQRYIEPLEVDLSRALAASGFPVLRFYCQGYGDSSRIDARTSLSTHVSDTLEAVELLREHGAAEVGLVGARFGGAVAALVAEQVEAERLILWDPVVTGAAYLRNVLRQQTISALTQKSELEGWSHGQWNGQRTQTDELRELMQSGGDVYLDGLMLHAEAREEIEHLDLTRDLQHLRAESLVVQVSRSTAPRRELTTLVEHLQRVGGASTLTTVAPVTGESALGSPRHVARGDDPDGRLKRDLQAQLSATLTAETVRWVEGSLAR